MHWLALGLVFLVHAPASVEALARRPLSIRELTAAADTVAIGRVGPARSERSATGTEIVTRIPLDVEQVLKGAPAAALTIVQAGGEVGGVAAVLADAPTFAAGERVLVFLTRRPDGALRVAHLYQGKFTIEPDPATSQPQAVRRAPDARTVLDALPLADALALVRAALPSPPGGGR